MHIFREKDELFFLIGCGSISAVLAFVEVICMDRKINVLELPEASNVCQQVLREVWGNSLTSIAHVIMSPGGISLLHEHHTFAEVYYILSGEGILTCGNDEIHVEAETAAVIPSHTPHKLRNIGTSPLKHLVISSPRFNPKDIILLENP